MGARPPFQGSSFHTKFTGNRLPRSQAKKKGGGRGIPVTWSTWVSCSSKVSFKPPSPRSEQRKSEAKEETLPPKVGRSLNQPTMGMTVSLHACAAGKRSRGEKGQQGAVEEVEELEKGVPGHGFLT